MINIKLESHWAFLARGFGQRPANAREQNTNLVTLQARGSRSSWRKCKQNRSASFLQRPSWSMFCLQTSKCSRFVLAASRPDGKQKPRVKISRVSNSSSKCSWLEKKQPSVIPTEKGQRVRTCSLSLW